MGEVDYDSIPYLQVFKNEVEEQKENIISLVGGTYKEKDDVMTVSYHDWLLGYKVYQFEVYVIRKVFIEFPEKWGNIPKEKKDPRIMVILQVFFRDDIKQAPAIAVSEDEKCLIISQPDIPNPIFERVLN